MTHIHATRIDDLIKRHCPNGVVFRPLGGLVKIRNGKDHKPLGDGPIPAYGTGGILRYVDTPAYSGPSVLIPRKGSLEKLYYVDEPFWTVDTIFYTEVGSELNPKFLYYCLYKLRLAELNQAGGVPSLTQSGLNRIPIPVPPLVVQEEIVRILDTFTQLEAELEAELEARRQQYEHYRSSSFGSILRAEYVNLSEICRVGTGSSVSKARIANNRGKYPVINSGKDPLGYIDSYNTEDDPIGITSRGAGVGSVTWCDGRYFRGALNYSVSISDPAKVDLRYLFHALNFLQPQIKKLSTFQGIPALNKTNLEKLRVPLPHIRDQRRLATFLDEFDALTTDLSAGLPAEISARRQQYEFYRDRLLSFEELRA